LEIKEPEYLKRKRHALVLLPGLLVLSLSVCAQTPTDADLEELERQIEQQEAEQAEAKRRAEAEAKRKAEEEARRKAEEEARREQEAQARAQAEAEAQRMAEEKKRRMQLEQQQEKFKTYMNDADAAMSAGNFSSALQAYTQALEIFPDDGAALAGYARAEEFRNVCVGIVGEWSWVFGSTTIVRADGTLQNIFIIPNQGTWECTDPSQRKFTLRWEVGGWVDDMVLSADGDALDGRNNIGMPVSGRRKK
jgi:tetratricopeptide (TPR) repeat protein